HQHVRSRVPRLIHLVVAVERRYVPGNRWRDSSNEGREARDLVAGIVEARDQQSDDLEPEVHRVQPAYGIENGIDSAAKLAVMTIVEAFEIDLVEVDPWAKVFEHPWCSIAIRHEAGCEPGGLGLFEDGHRPFARDERFVVRADHNGGTKAERIFDQLLGSGLQRRRHSGWVAKGL